MNTVNLIGFLATDPKASGDAATFLLAVRRNYESKDGETADFINCIGWGGLATNILKHLHKGSKIALTGSIKTSHYTDAGGFNRLGWQVVAEQVTFLDPKPQSKTPDLDQHNQQQYYVAPARNPKPDFSQYIKQPEPTRNTIEVTPEVAEAIKQLQQLSKQQRVF
ncbi:single-stranded DNA-binding protein [Lacticaseibacillus daqingensis]|uniref:single-stranded DNA-binding protein n=1 Tax=Lacticaseibacillus daqingensis TaxID=2486014 RepID=UPI000F795EBB|nr:single-stranded DNA-binding protein [Lacticaseibacillus daqingensis]